jgi:hypothetical protein
MNAPGGQMALPVEAKLPVSPWALLAIAPLDRQALYKRLGLDFRQRGCVEAAIRLIRAGE